MHCTWKLPGFRPSRWLHLTAEGSVVRRRAIDRTASYGLDLIDSARCGTLPTVRSLMLWDFNQRR
jgi:hypothetical protein